MTGITPRPELPLVTLPNPFNPDNLRRRKSAFDPFLYLYLCLSLLGISFADATGLIISTLLPGEAMLLKSEKE